MIVNGAIYLMLNDKIYYGNINNELIYVPEIIISFSTKDDFSMLINLSKFTKIKYNISRISKRR